MAHTDSTRQTLGGGLARLERIATALLARRNSIRYDVTRTMDEREEVFRLRYRAVIERGWATPQDLPNGLERDADDERAVLIGAWNGADAVAAARMIFPEPGQRLPVESLFDLVVEPAGHVVHVDRITVARSAGDRASRLLIGLIARCWLEMRARGYHVWAGIDSPGSLRLYRRLGFEMTVLGPPRRYWSEERFPVRFDPTDGVRHLRKLLEDQG